LIVCRHVKRRLCVSYNQWAVLMLKWWQWKHSAMPILDTATPIIEMQRTNEQCAVHIQKMGCCSCVRCHHRSELRSSFSCQSSSQAAAQHYEPAYAISIEQTWRMYFCWTKYGCICFRCDSSSVCTAKVNSSQRVRKAKEKT
jgi:hypothetical protein